MSMFEESKDKTVYPFVSVDYEEFKPETYRGIIVEYEGNQTRIFSGDFEKDYDYVCMEYQPFMKSSSVDNFISDVTNANKDLE